MLLSTALLFRSAGSAGPTLTTLSLHSAEPADSARSAAAPHPSPSPAVQPIRRDVEALGDQIAELAAHIQAATYRLLVLIRSFDEQEGWANGFRTCAHWLAWRTGINVGAAREKVRVARALGTLPRLSDALRRGELSYAKARALTRVATPANEAELVDLGRRATAAQIERVVRGWRRADRLEEAADERIRHQSRGLTLFAGDDGMWQLQGRLDPEMGAVLLRALESAEQELFAGVAPTPDPDSSVSRPTPTQRLADAMGLVAERSLGGATAPNRADRFQVVLHTSTTDLTTDADPGGGELEDGGRVSAETSRRIACDASRVVMCKDDRGRSLDVGRRSRTVPSALRRALKQRDRRRCRFPGCDVRHTDAHHIRHWADGGQTRLNNLVLLCRRHHRAVHEDGFGVRMVDGQPQFTWPDGREFPGVPCSRAPLEDADRDGGTGRDLLESLFACHEAHDLGIGPWTVRHDWADQRLDVGFAVDALRDFDMHPAGSNGVRRP